MLVNAAFQNALSNDIVAERPELWSEVWLCIKNDPICYKLMIISIATGTSMKYFNSKSLSSFKASQELSFSRIMHAHMLQTPFQTSVPLNTCNSFFGLLHRICRLLSICGIWLVGISLEFCVLGLQKTNFVSAYKQYAILFYNQTFKVCFDSMPCSIVTLIAIHGGYTIYWFWTLFFYYKIFSFICTYTSCLFIKFHLILMISSWCFIFY